MTSQHADTFARLHVPGQPLLLANCWDAGSARLIESCGAAAMATTSAGLAWSRGYPDGDALPPSVLAGAVREITRVLSVPLSVDAEGGYSDDPKVVAENVRAIVDAGADGIFVPAVTDPDNIRTIASAVELPLNVLTMPGLPSISALATLGVARISAGSGIAQIAAGVVRSVATEFLAGRLEPLVEGRSVDYGLLNALFAANRES
jgi:2-methylisocitrate lyase-like PEP mutase family enzyme